MFGKLKPGRRGPRGTQWATDCSPRIPLYEPLTESAVSGRPFPTRYAVRTAAGLVDGREPGEVDLEEDDTPARRG